MEKEYLIRKANLDDLDLIVKLRLAFFQELDPNEFEKNHQLLEKQTKDYFFRKMKTGELESWFACDKEKVVSVYSLLTNEMPPALSDYGGGKEGYFFNVYTLPEYRKHGLASLLTKHMLEKAKKNKHNRIWLTYSCENAKKIYAKLGFKSRADVMEVFLNY
jgi:ribosomal protein S18 acetylase RimI-like enzyme